MRATAGRQIELADRDDTDIDIDFRIAAELQRGELAGIRKPRTDREIVVDDRVREILGSGEVGFGNAIAREIDRQCALAEPRRSGRGPRAIEQRAREQVLCGVLRHVLATAPPLDRAGDFGARLERRRTLDDVHDRAVLGLLRVEHGDPGERAVITELATGFGIERGLIEHDRRAILVRGQCYDLGGEALRERVVVIQPKSHGVIVMI